MATPIIAGVAAVTTLAGSAISSRAASSAASTQADAANRAADLQQQQFERNVELQEPFRQAGIEGQNRLATLLGMQTGDTGAADFGKYATAEYTPAMFAQGQDPGYQFRLSEGLKALDRQAAARGGLISGAALKASMRYGQDMGSQEFMNAFNRYQTERMGTLNPFQSMAGQGQSATNQLTSLGQNYANQAGQAMGAAGQARASGYVGQANAINQGISGLTNMYFQNQFLNRAYPQNNLNSSIYANSPYNELQDPGGMAQTNIGFSDIRLKTNIECIGTRPDGLGVYKFEYIWGGGDQIGLMAQEVQNVYPEAIGEIDGFLTVDYSKV
jgi:hypothetical protein